MSVREELHTLDMQVALTVMDAAGTRREVSITAPDGNTLGEGTTELLAGLGLAMEEEPDFWSGSRRLPVTALIGGPGLRGGDQLSIGRPGPREANVGAVLRLHVVAGPDAGRCLNLPRGILVIGRAPDC